MNPAKADTVQCLYHWTVELHINTNILYLVQCPIR